MINKINDRKSYLLVLAIFIFAFLIIGIAVNIVPPTIALYYQIRGSRVYQQVLSWEGESPKPGFSCTIAIPQSQLSHAALLKAIRYLDRAKRTNPNLTQALLTQGRVLCLQGKPDEAVQSFINFSQLRPKNPIGDMEIVTGIEAYWLTNSSQQIDLSNEHQLQTNQYNVGLLADRYKESLNKLYGTPAHLLEIASQMFDIQNYQEAERTFWRAALIGDQLTESDKFKWVVVSILNKGGLSIIPITTDYTHFIYPNDAQNIHQIDGKELFWISPDMPKYNFLSGTSIAEIPSQGPDAGIIWWAGTAGVIIQVPIESPYLITIRAKHIDDNNSKNGELEILYNMTSALKSDLSNDWKEFQVCIPISGGTHLIGIKYTQDVGDVIIDWVRFEPVPTCGK